MGVCKNEPIGKVPVLETPVGPIFESNSIACYGQGSCNLFIEESAGCSRRSSCFKHFTGWEFCNPGRHCYNVQLIHGLHPTRD